MSSYKTIRMATVALVCALVAFAGFAQEAASQGKAAPAPAGAAAEKGKAAPPAKQEAAKAKDSKKEADAAKDGKQYKPLAEARAKIGEIIADASKMVEVMKTLSPEDQKTFVADVNAAIEKLPGSTEDKTAKYLNVNRAALKGASEGNMAEVLAVTFATVPPESLTVISERYANDLFNRDADPSHKFSDAVFEKTAMEVVGKVEQATTGSDDAGVRNTLAILMFVRADNGTIDGLSDRLVATMPDSTSRELAKKEWIPQALAEDDKKSYDSMLAYADAGKSPNIELVLNLAGPQILDAMLVDITSGMDNSFGYQTTPVLDQAFGGFEDNVIPARTDTTGMNANNVGGNAVPRTVDPTAPWNPAYKRDSIEETKDEIRVIEKIIEPEPEPEPKPYPYTSL